MKRGSIPVSSLAGGLDLDATLESGQSYTWRREDGAMFDGAEEDRWYWTVVDGHFFRVRQRDGLLEWESTTEGEDTVVELLRLNDDLDAVRASAPADAVVRESFDAFPGLRLVQDPPFSTLVSFICSAQMRVERIHEMQVRLAETYGETMTVEGRAYASFPTPESLAAATESELRDLGLGYRAPYVRASAEMVADGFSPSDVVGAPYEDARDELTAFVGVGDKVADCVLLFSLGYLEAVPLDTWIRRSIETHFPGCDRGNYAKTSRAIRERLGGEYAGYVQTYVFHYLRTRA